MRHLIAAVALAMAVPAFAQDTAAAPAPAADAAKPAPAADTAAKPEGDAAAKPAKKATHKKAKAKKGDTTGSVQTMNNNGMGGAGDEGTGAPKKAHKKAKTAKK